jgi:mRNA interferase YafQ
MYRIFETSDFKKSYRALLESGQFKPRSKARTAFREIIEYLKNDTRLPAHFRDHALTGDYAGYRECHIKGDLLLVYEKKEDVLILVLIDIGSHSQLFG